MSVFAGAEQFVRGIRLSVQPGVARYSWMPVAFSLVVIGLGLAYAFSYVNDFSVWLSAQLPGLLDFLSWILIPLLYLLGILVGAWLAGFLAVTVAGPFLGDLSRRVEAIELGAAPPDTVSFGAGLAAGARRELRKLGYYLPRLLGVFVLTLIPLVNAVAPLIWFLFGAWTLAVQFCDYPTENRNRPFSETLTRLRNNRAAALGFGGCATLALAIPLVNFLVIPVAVAGGTMLWHRLEPAPDAQP